MDDGAKVLLGVVAALLAAVFAVALGEPFFGFLGTIVGAGVFELDSALWNLTAFLFKAWSPNAISMGGWAIAGLLFGIGLGPALVALRYRRLGTALLFILGGVTLAACLTFLASRGEQGGPSSPWLELRAEEEAIAEKLILAQAQQEQEADEASLARLERLSTLLDKLDQTIDTNKKSRLKAQKKAERETRRAAEARKKAQAKPTAKKAQQKKPAAKKDASAGSTSGSTSRLKGKIRVEAKDRVLLGGKLKVYVKFEGLTDRSCSVKLQYLDGTWQSLPTATKQTGKSGVMGQFPTTAGMDGHLDYTVKVRCGSDTWNKSGSARIR